MYKEKEHESSGITLIALVVTIIILIILATITLRGVFGEGGLIQEAKGMKQNTDKEISNSEEELSQSEQEYLNAQVFEAVPYTITFKVGENVYQTMQGSKITFPEEPVTDGYLDFAGWYYDQGATNKAEEGTQINRDLTLYAKYNLVVLYFSAYAEDFGHTDVTRFELDENGFGTNGCKIRYTVSSDWIWTDFLDYVVENNFSIYSAAASYSKITKNETDFEMYKDYQYSAGIENHTYFYWYPGVSGIYAIHDTIDHELTEKVLPGIYSPACENMCYACLKEDTEIDVIEEDEKGNKKRKKKKIKDMKVGDKVVSINPFTGKLEEDIVTYVDGDENKKHKQYDKWEFSDGTILQTVYRHRFYNIEKQGFVYMDEWTIGEHGYNIDGEKIELISHEVITEVVQHCTIFTQKWNNYFANGMLSGNRNSSEIKL